MNYEKAEKLGLTIMSEKVDTGEAIRLGVTEGVADSAKYITLGVIALIGWMALPDAWKRKLIRTRRRVRW